MLGAWTRRSLVAGAAAAGMTIVIKPGADWDRHSECGRRALV